MISSTGDDASGQSCSPIVDEYEAQADDATDAYDSKSSRAHITDLERAQIWAALSARDSQTSKGSSTHQPYVFAPTAIGTQFKSSPHTKPRRASKSKRLGNAIKRIFLNNEQNVGRKSRDSWDDIYRDKDNAKVRPIHEEYGVL